MVQWRQYIEQHTDLSLTVIQRRNQIASPLPLTDIVLCSSTMCRPLLQEMGGVQWSRVVVDECTSIQLPRCPTLRGCFHWLISSSTHTMLFPSGTYCTLGQPGLRRQYCERMQRTGFLRQVLQQLELFPTVRPLFLKCSDSFIEQSFNLPPLACSTLLCQAPAYLSLVHGVASAEVTRMLHAGDVEGALQMLPCPRGSADNLLSRLTTDLDDRILRPGRPSGPTTSSCWRPIWTTSPARRCSSAWRRPRRRWRSCRRSGRRCSSGCSTTTKKYAPCAWTSPHTRASPAAASTFFVSSACNGHWRCTTAAPTAAAPLRRTTMMLINETRHRTACPPRQSSCCAACAGRRNRRRASGASSSSANYESFDKITAQLEPHPFRYGKLCGASAAIQRQLQQFESGATPVLLLNATHYGAGLNLQRATTWS